MKYLVLAVIAALVAVSARIDAQPVIPVAAETSRRSFRRTDASSLTAPTRTIR